MKVLIQNFVTNLYLCIGEKDQWCEDTAKAKDFGNGVVAIDYTIQHNLTDCQVILNFGNPQLDIALPVRGPRVIQT